MIIAERFRPYQTTKKFKITIISVYDVIREKGFVNLGGGTSCTVRCMLLATKLRNMILFLKKTEQGGDMKPVRHCSIDVLESKNDFGMSAPP